MRLCLCGQSVYEDSAIKTLKSFSYIFILIFLTDTLAWSSPSSASSEFSPPAVHVPIHQVINNPSGLAVPSQFVTLKEFHKGTNGKLLIHIQDAHSNYSGQMNMAKALEQMMRQTGMEVVLVEGGDQEVTLNETKKIADSSVWKIAANRLLLQGVISGEEYLNLTSDLPIRLLGIEYQDLYNRNLLEYKQLVDQREKLMKYLSKIHHSLQAMKERYYPDELKEYEKNLSDNDGFGSAFESLMRLSTADQEQTRGAYPEMRKLSSLKQTEDGIDFQAANREQTELIRRLSDSGFKDEVSSVIQRKTKTEVSHSEQIAQLTALFNLANGSGIDTADFQYLQIYQNYLSLFSEISMDRLLPELDRFEDVVYSNILKDENTRKIRAIDRYTGLLTKAFEIKISSDEYRMLKANRVEFDSRQWQGFMNSLLKNVSDYDLLVPFQEYIDEAYPVLDAFYETVAERDKAFVKNAGELLEKTSQRSAFLIAGGYHTANLTKLIREAGYSYLVLTPVVEFETDHKQYEKNLLQGLTLIPQVETNGFTSAGNPDKNRFEISTLKKLPWVKSFTPQTEIWNVKSDLVGNTIREDLGNGIILRNNPESEIEMDFSESELISELNPDAPVTVEGSRLSGVNFNWNWQGQNSDEQFKLFRAGLFGSTDADLFSSDTEETDTADYVISELEGALEVLHQTFGVTNFKDIGDAFLIYSQLTPDEFRDDFEGAVAKGIENVGKKQNVFTPEKLQEPAVENAIIRYLETVFFRLDSITASRTQLRDDASFFYISNNLDNLEIGAGTQVSFDVFRSDIELNLKSVIPANIAFRRSLNGALDAYEASLSQGEQPSGEGFFDFIRSELFDSTEMENQYISFRNRWMQEPFWDFIQMGTVRVMPSYLGTNNLLRRAFKYGDVAAPLQRFVANIGITDTSLTAPDYFEAIKQFRKDTKNKKTPERGFESKVVREIVRYSLRNFLKTSLLEEDKGLPDSEKNYDGDPHGAYTDTQEVVADVFNEEIVSNPDVFSFLDSSLGLTAARLSAESEASDRASKPVTDIEISRFTESIMRGDSDLSSDYEVPAELKGAEIDGSSRYKFLKTVAKRQQQRLEVYEELERQGIVLRAKLYRSAVKKKRDKTAFLFFDIYDTENERRLKSRVEEAERKKGSPLTEDEIREQRYRPLDEDELRYGHNLMLVKEEDVPVEVFIFPHQWRNGYLPVQTTVHIDTRNRTSTAYWGEKENKDPEMKVLNGNSYEFKGIGTKGYRDHVEVTEHEDSPDLRKKLAVTIFKTIRDDAESRSRKKTLGGDDYERYLKARIRSIISDVTEKDIAFRTNGGAIIRYANNKFIVYERRKDLNLSGNDGSLVSGKFLGKRYQRVSKNYIGGLNAQDEQGASQKQYDLLENGADLGAWIHDVQNVDQKLLGAAFRIRTGSGVRLTDIDQSVSGIEDLYQYIADETQYDNIQMMMDWLPESFAKDGILVRSIMKSNLTPHEHQGIGKDKDTRMKLYDVDYLPILSRRDANNPEKDKLVTGRRRGVVYLELKFITYFYSRFKEKTGMDNPYVFIAYAEGLLHGTGISREVIREYWSLIEGKSGTERARYIAANPIGDLIRKRLSEAGYSDEQIQVLFNMRNVLSRAAKNKEFSGVTPSEEALKEVDYVVYQWRRANQENDTALGIESITETDKYLDQESEAERQGSRLGEEVHTDALSVRLNAKLFEYRPTELRDEVFDQLPKQLPEYLAKTGARLAFTDQGGAYLVSADRTIITAESAGKKITKSADSSRSQVFDIAPVSLTSINEGVRNAFSVVQKYLEQKRSPVIKKITRQFKFIKIGQEQRKQLGELVLVADGLITESMIDEASVTGIAPDSFKEQLASWRSGISLTDSAEGFGGHFSVTFLNSGDRRLTPFIEAVKSAGFDTELADDTRPITYITPAERTPSEYAFSNGSGRTDNVSIFAYQDTKIESDDAESIVASTNKVLVTAAAVNFKKQMLMSGQKSDFGNALRSELAALLYADPSKTDAIDDKDQMIEQAASMYIFRRSVFENFLFAYQAVWSEIGKQLLSNAESAWSA